MGQPLARIGDNHTCPITAGTPHIGGPISSGCTTVLAGGQPAARRLDKATCVGGIDVISLGSFSVLIGGQPAAREGDMTVHGGKVAAGLPSILVGDVIASGGSSQTFDTQEEAARAGLNAANPQSITANKEFGGLIYRDSNGRYGYTGPSPGTGDGFNPYAPDVAVPQSTTLVGDYHTHADYAQPDTNDIPTRTSDAANDGYKSDNFSQPDRDGITGDAQNNPDYRGYLGTPSGTFREYNPHTNTTRTILSGPQC
jgi:uncharacterized Zn-binding protein involved in type VI secretion